MLGGLTQAAVEFLTRYGYLALFVFAFLETSMVFPLLPSELVLPVAAGLLVHGPVTLVAFALVAAGGATAGSLFAYVVFGTAGVRAADRYGAYVRVSQTDIERSRRWFQRWGETAVLWGRLLPVLRSVISIPAGFARMNRATFAAYSAVGSLLFALGVGAVVYYGRQRSVYSFVWVALPDWLTAPLAASPVLAVLLGGLVLVALGVGWRYARRRREDGTGDGPED
ncbi:DedA family protein [Halobacterium zhouii]|uniref:DedA family protein n=1 Tax=Halobacterium zhouii TaxID=2902624 RepID=UPI001E2AF2B8|nr:DedA family protein [Halobacterium zhouii]